MVVGSGHSARGLTLLNLESVAPLLSELGFVHVQLLGVLLYDLLSAVKRNASGVPPSRWPSSSSSPSRLWLQHNQFLDEEFCILGLASVVRGRSVRRLHALSRHPRRIGRCRRETHREAEEEHEHPNR